MKENQGIVFDSYTSLAMVYDLFMNEVPYAAMVCHLQDFWQREGYHINTVLDAGCGTGAFIVPLAQAGFDTCGVDLSSEMLAIADNKAYNQGVSCVFIERDLRELRLAPQFDGVISFFDTLNYILTLTDLEKVLTGVYQCLLPSGSFVFDMRTLHYYADVLGENIFRDEKNGCCLIWENHFENAHIYMNLDFFLPDGKGLYHRYQEEHIQRGYVLTEIIALLQRVGFIDIALSEGLDNDWHHVTDLTVDKQSILDMEQKERVFFACKKNQEGTGANFYGRE